MTRRTRRALLALAAGMLAVVLAAACAHLPGAGRPSSLDSAAVATLLAGAKNPACPLPGVATSGQPDSAQVFALARAGIRTVLDLRSPAESRGFDEAAVMRAAGLEYVRLPVTPATLDDSTFTAARELLQRITTAPALVHCASGNRVGAVMIPWLVLDRGWKLERAVETAKRGGLQSAELEAKARTYVAKQRAAR